MKLTPWIPAAAALIALAACGKAQEAIGQRAVEKAIEHAAAKDGVKAEVHLGDGKGGTSITTTDASGQTTKAEFGSATVTEAEVGVPFYPGAKVSPGGTRIASADATQVMVDLTSADPADKVAAFYVEKLKARAAGGQFADMNDGNSHTIMSTDEGGKGMVQISVQKRDGAEGGTGISIVAVRGSK